MLLNMILSVLYLLIYLAVPYGTQDLSSLTGDRTRTLCSGSTES